MLPWAVGPLSNRAPEYQNRYTLINRDGRLRYSALSRRILTLPPEILAEIFFCRPFDEDLPLVTPHPDRAPLVLCIVCRQWRSVVLLTPKLWSSIFFESHRLNTKMNIWIDSIFQKTMFILLQDDGTA
ncbi:hypothetical protein DFH08DRAFT_897710 [Mycena albidolilacea]|uniref:F-box domain-containing protein n=1 Tax=Mycena albidolilacea TaxID=1033008 RepID=A0AAD6Z7Y4_9AGAR|nr:hypothetical protein DFH08DRAFT_897710 [Mycena albidolilacea]